MKNTSSLAALLTACLCVPANAQSMSETLDIDHAAVFETMKTLVGDYREIAEPDESAKVSYTLMSRGSALLETWNMPNGEQELTIFHMDNSTLVATHYCAANIQSTMMLNEKSEDGTLRFRLRSASNLPSADASHNSGFEYRFSDSRSVHRNEIWTKAGAATLSSMKLIRQTRQ